MEVEEAEERNTELLDLGLGIGDYYVPKGTQKQRKKDTSVPFLQLSVTFGSEEEEGINGNGPSVHQEEENGNKKKSDFISIRNKNGNIMSSRKKLRLTKEQSTLLEFSFNQHATLNPVQKHALAEQLNLTPRQVEVWFQNRRARTKLKQTEVDYEILKKCCESLNDENTKLKKELQELKCQKLKKSPLCLHLPICSSCEKKATFQCGYYHQQQ